MFNKLSNEGIAKSSPDVLVIFWSHFRVVNLLRRGLVSLTGFYNLSSIFNTFSENERIILNTKLDTVYHKTFASTIKPGTEFIPASSAWSNITNNSKAIELFTNVPLTAESGYNIDSLAISFHLDNNSNIYFWVLNKSMSSEVYFHFNFKQTSSIISFLQNGLFENLNASVVNLQPGEAKFFSLNNAYTNSKSFCNNVFSGVYKDDWANNITLGGSGCNVIFNNSARKNFKGRLLTLNPGVSITEGASVFLNSYEVKTGTIRSSNKSNNSKGNYAETEFKESSDMTVYPNPTSTNSFFIRVNGKNLFKDVKIRILSINNLNIPFNIINFGDYYKIELIDAKIGIYLIEGKFNSQIHYQKIVVTN